jgi:serine/threonine protein kinase
MVVSDAQPGGATASAGPRAVIGGRFEIDLTSPFATGGICHVYRGRDRRTRAEVAAKTLRVEYRRDPQMRARFRREARLLAFLKHPNIVRVEAFVEEKDASWVVLEFLAGGSLRQRIERDAPLSPEAVVPLLDQAASGLAHLHGRGIVHLDVSPENLLLAGNGTLKLIDLGLAQPAGRPQESMGSQTVASAAYLAPEQACGEPVEPATDLYALGCVVYELLTGHPPFVAPGTKPPLNEIVNARLKGDPLPPSRVRPDLGLPPWVDDVLRWALARDPAARYSDVGAFARLFRSGVEGDLVAGSIEPPSPTPTEVAHRPISRFDRQWVGPRPRSGWPGCCRGRQAAGSRTGTLRRRRPGAGASGRGRRLLWTACTAVLAIDVLLGGVLLATQGRLPGVWEPAGALRAGEEARVVGEGLLVRSGPSWAASPLGQLEAER